MNEQAAIVLSINNNNHVSNITTLDRGLASSIIHPHTPSILGTTSRRSLLGPMLTEEATIGNMHFAFLSKTLLGLLLTPLVLSLERAVITGVNNKKDELSSSSLSASSSAWLLDEKKKPSPSHSGLEEYQKHRSTLFFPLLCQLGLPSLCVCRGAGLQAAIDAGNRWVIVCPGATMQLSTEMDLTGATLQVFCGALFGLRPCTINGQGITRLFHRRHRPRRWFVCSLEIYFQEMDRS